jgi:hypothetical protein
LRAVALRIGAALCLGLALLAKETSVVLLPACAVLDLLGPAPRRAWRTWPLLLALGAGFVALRAGVAGPLLSNSFRRLDNPLAFEPSCWLRLLDTARVHAVGLGLLGWPATLSADYSHDALPMGSATLDSSLALALALYATAGAHSRRLGGADPVESGSRTAGALRAGYFPEPSLNLP